MKTNTDWIRQADTALRRAAKRAREIAVRTHTAVHVVKEGKIVNLLDDRNTLVLREEPPAYGAKSE